MCIEENVLRVRERAAEAAIRAGRRPEDVLIVAATKLNDSSRVRRAIAAGLTAVGENRVQELLKKDAEGAYQGAEKHFIGRLQKNKAKFVVGVCSLIQSVDSPELLGLIGRLAAERGIRQDVLIEVNIGGESAKGGVSPQRLPELLAVASVTEGVFVRGLMTIPPADGQSRRYFENMYRLFVDIRQKKYDNVDVALLSMGMSGDFEDAILEGASIIRPGSAIFGARAPKQPL